MSKSHQNDFNSTKNVPKNAHKQSYASERIRRYIQEKAAIEKSDTDSPGADKEKEKKIPQKKDDSSQPQISKRRVSNINPTGAEEAVSTKSTGDFRQRQRRRSSVSSKLMPMRQRAPSRQIAGSSAESDTSAHDLKSWIASRNVTLESFMKGRTSGAMQGAAVTPAEEKEKTLEHTKRAPLAPPTPWKSKVRTSNVGTGKETEEDAAVDRYADLRKRRLSINVQPQVMSEGEESNDGAGRVSISQGSQSSGSSSTLAYRDHRSGSYGSRRMSMMSSGSGFSTSSVARASFRRDFAMVEPWLGSQFNALDPEHADQSQKVRMNQSRMSEMLQRRRSQRIHLVHAIGAAFGREERATRIAASLVPDEILIDVYNRSIKRFEAVLLIGDISGFTELTERYTVSAKGGTSRLTAILNSYIGSMVQVILEKNGDVLKFAGDAYLVMWKLEKNQTYQDEMGQALDCACEIQKLYGTRATDVGVMLGVKVAISCGQVLFSVIGDEMAKHYVVVGQPVWDMKKAGLACTRGDVLVTQHAWQFVNSQDYLHENLPDGKHVRVSGVGPTWARTHKGQPLGLSPPPQLSSAEPSLLEGEAGPGRPMRMPGAGADGGSADFGGDVAVARAEVRELLAERGLTGQELEELPLRPTVALALDDEMLPELRPFIIKPVLRGLDLDEPLEYLTEMRQVVVVFVNVVIRHLDKDNMIPVVDRCYRQSCRMAEAVHGCVNKVSLFDKDCMILIIFGLRGFKTARESQIALRCAADLRQALLLEHPGLGVSAAVTSGTAYCGVVGHPYRREYTVIGGSVNKAARMMCAYPNKVTCDQDAYLDSKLETIHFDVQEDRQMKGIRNAGTIYEYAESERKPLDNDVLELCTLPLLGRDEECKEFEELFTTMKERTEDKMGEDSTDPRQQLRWANRRHNAILVEAEPRQGKTRLLEEFLLITKTYPRFRVQLFPRDAPVPYSGLRQLLLKVLALDAVKGVDLQQAVAKKLHAVGVDRAYMCVVNPIFEVRFPITPPFRKLSQPQRILAQRIAVERLATLSFPSIAVACIDDADFLDSHSWRLLHSIVELDVVFLVFLISSHINKLCCEAQELLSMRWRVHRMRLKALGKWYHAPLACQLLDVWAIPPELEKVLQQYSGGNPGWVESYLTGQFRKGTLVILNLPLVKLNVCGLVTPPPYLISRIVAKPDKEDKGVAKDKGGGGEGTTADRWLLFAAAGGDSGDEGHTERWGCGVGAIPATRPSISTWESVREARAARALAHAHAKGLRDRRRLASRVASAPTLPATLTPGGRPDSPSDPMAHIVAACVRPPGYFLEEPHSMYGVNVLIMQTLDSLNPFEQLLLKCSSVIGETFERAMLLAMMGASTFLRQVAQAVKHLFEIRVLLCASRALPTFRGAPSSFNDPEWNVCQCQLGDIAGDCKDLPKFAHCATMRFRSTQIRDTTYSLLTEAQMREYHSAAIMYIENNVRRCHSCQGGYFPVSLTPAARAADPLRSSRFRALGQQQASSSSEISSEDVELDLESEHSDDRIWDFGGWDTQTSASEEDYPKKIPKPTQSEEKSAKQNTSRSSHRWKRKSKKQTLESPGNSVSSLSSIQTKASNISKTSSSDSKKRISSKPGKPDKSKSVTPSNISLEEVELDTVSVRTESDTSRASLGLSKMKKLLSRKQKRLPRLSFRLRGRKIILEKKELKKPPTEDSTPRSPSLSPSDIGTPEMLKPTEDRKNSMSQLVGSPVAGPSKTAPKDADERFQRDKFKQEIEAARTWGWSTAHDPLALIRQREFRNFIIVDQVLEDTLRQENSRRRGKRKDVKTQKKRLDDMCGVFPKPTKKVRKRMKVERLFDFSRPLDDDSKSSASSGLEQDPKENDKKVVKKKSRRRWKKKLPKCKIPCTKRLPSSSSETSSEAAAGAARQAIEEAHRDADDEEFPVKRRFSAAFSEQVSLLRLPVVKGKYGTPELEAIDPSFATIDYRLCQCNKILLSLYENLLRHSMGANLPNRVMDILLDYAEFCIELENQPLAMRLLREAQVLLSEQSRAYTLEGSEEESESEDEYVPRTSTRCHRRRQKVEDRTKTPDKGEAKSNQKEGGGVLDGGGGGDGKKGMSGTKRGGLVRTGGCLGKQGEEDKKKGDEDNAKEDGGGGDHEKAQVNDDKEGKGAPQKGSNPQPKGDVKNRIPKYQIPYVYGRIQMLHGWTRITMAQIEQGTADLRRALRAFRCHFPQQTLRVRAKLKVAQARQFKLLQRMRSQKRPQHRGFHARCAVYESQCLCLLCDRFIAEGDELRAALAAYLALNCALQVSPELTTLAKGLSRTQQAMQRARKWSAARKLERFTLHTMKALLRVSPPDDVWQTRALGRLMATLARLRVQRGELKESQMLGANTLHIASCVDDTEIRCEMLVLLVEARIMRGEIDDAAMLLHQLEYLCEKDVAREDTFWFYALCLFTSTFAGFDMIPMRKLKEFLTTERSHIWRESSSGPARRLSVVTWIWHLRREEWADAIMWGDMLHDLDPETPPKDDAREAVTEMLRLEGLLILMVHYINEGDIFAGTEIGAKVTILTKQLWSLATRLRCLMPSLLLLRGFRRRIRRADRKSLSLVRRGISEAHKQGNVLWKARCELSKRAWMGMASDEELCAWREVSEDVNGINWKDVCFHGVVMPVPALIPPRLRGGFPL